MPFLATGQQVIVHFLGVQHPRGFFGSEGEFIDPPEQHISATLRASASTSFWTNDSMMYKREGYFADGYQAYIPGRWDYRNKKTGKMLSHRLFFGEKEFIESPIAEIPYSVYTNCQEWTIHTTVTKTVLGMSCLKATRQCGNKEHVVYFTRSIPIIDGPIYVSALPGLILEFDDGMVHWLAQHITANEDEIPAPEEVRLVNKALYGPADSRLIISKKHNTLVVNEWIDLTRHYLVR
jgi:GLPGLI family protein